MATPIRRGIRALIRSTTAADNPPEGQRLLVPHADGWYDRDSAGTETRLGGGGAGAAPLVVQAGETYTVAANTQVAVGRPIRAQGRVVIAGTLVQVGPA